MAFSFVMCIFADCMEIIYEDNHVIIVAKRSGEIVQGDKTGDEPLSETVKAYIKEKYQKPGAVFLGVVHRLDRPVSGLVVFARTSKALVRLNEMFSSHEKMRKVYWALVRKVDWTKLQADADGWVLLENYLLRREEQNKSFVVDIRTHGAKLAKLRFRLLRQLDNYDLLEIELLTGRHHQIRCQLANVGCPVKGDLKYGAKRSNPDGGISLHAHELTFLHPVRKEPITLTAPPPWHEIEQTK